MSVPDFSSLAETVFNSYPDDVTRLNALCDQCEADRAAFGEDDPRVQAGESTVNNLKGLFTRRIAWACFQQDDRFGLRKKTSGALATRSDGVTHSTDALLLHDDGQIVDVMSDRKWSWNATPGDTQPREQWIKPLPPEGEPVPTPTPVPVPIPTPETAPTVDLLELLTIVREVASNQLALGQQFDALTRAIEEKPVPTVTLPPWPRYIGKIPYLGTVALTPEK